MSRIHGKCVTLNWGTYFALQLRKAVWCYRVRSFPRRLHLLELCSVSLGNINTTFHSKRRIYGIGAQGRNHLMQKVNWSLGDGTC